MMRIRTVILGGIVASISVLGTISVAQAQNLDLGALAAFNYVGKDASGAACHLNVSEIGRDFSGRFFQDFRVWVNGRADLNYTIRLKGPDRYRTPNAVQGSTAQFDIPMDIFVLSVFGNVADPAQLTEYRLLDGTGMGGAPFIRCAGIKPVPR